MSQAKLMSLGYSPEVDIWMECDGFDVIPLRQASPNFIIAFEAQHLPACNANIVVTVDGRRFVRPVFMNGMTPESAEATVFSRDRVSPF